MTVGEDVSITLVVVQTKLRCLVYVTILSCPTMNVAKPGYCWMKEIPETMVLQRIKVSPVLELEPGINLLKKFQGIIFKRICTAPSYPPPAHTLMTWEGFSLTNDIIYCLGTSEEMFRSTKGSTLWFWPLTNWSVSWRICRQCWLTEQVSRGEGGRE